MAASSLQSILREKYHIDEKLLVEGRFVALIGDYAADHVSLGLGSRCLLIARILSDGKEIDYELLHLLPLPAIYITCHESTKTIKIHSEVRATQVFQQCTTANQAEVWDNFTSTIREVYKSQLGDIRASLALHAAANSDTKRQRTPEFERTINNQQIFSRTYSRASLPTELPLHADGLFKSKVTSSRSFSLSVLDELKFDNFVNDAHTRFSEYKGYNVPCSWNCSADDVAKPHSEELKSDDIGASSLTIHQDSVDAKDEVKEEGRFLKFFRRIMCCCKSSQKNER